MTAPRHPAFVPRLMQAADAARYLGFSQSKFLTLGLPRKRHVGNWLYDVRDLDQFANDLPYEGAGQGEADQFNALFGLPSG